MADYVTVMYLGLSWNRPGDRIFHDPKHPYTQALLESIPASIRPRAPTCHDQRLDPASLQPSGGVSVSSPLHEIHARPLRSAPA